MQQMEWKLVPAQPTAEMVGAGAGVVFRLMTARQMKNPTAHEGRQ